MVVKRTKEFVFLLLILNMNSLGPLSKSIVHGNSGIQLLLHHHLGPGHVLQGQSQVFKLSRFQHTEKDNNGIEEASPILTSP